MKRGDIVTIALSGDYGKPRPALIIQSDALDQGESVLVMPFTSTLRDASFYRLTVAPSPENGLRSISQVMIDKIAPCPRGKCGPVIGRLETRDMAALGGLVAVMVGLAD